MIPIRRLGVPAVLAVAALVAFGALGGCGGAATTTTTQTPTTAATAGGVVVTLSEEENGARVLLAPGYTIELVLPGNPSAGETWVLGEYEEDVLKLLTPDPEFTPESDLDGAPGVFTWRFEAMAVGGTLLDLVYAGPDKEPIKGYTVELSVESGGAGSGGG